MRTGVFGLLIVTALLLATQPAVGVVIGMDWQLETVQSSAAPGQPSMAVDQQRGEIHVSYYSLADGSGELRYAHKDRAGWHRSTVDTGGGANVGQASAIALRNGFPVIAYVDATNHALKFAEFAILSGWTVSTLDSPGLGRPITGRPAMVVLPDGGVAITCWDAMNEDLVSYLLDPTSRIWSKKVVEANIGSLPTEDPAPSMVVDYRLGSDHPAFGVIYTRTTNGEPRVQYSWYDRNSGIWVHDTYFDGSKGMARDHGAVAFRFINGLNPRVWCDTSADGQLRYGSDWQVTEGETEARDDYAITADGVELNAYHTSLALHPCNLSSIAYTDPATNKLMYAWNDGFWHRSVVDSLSDARGATNRPILALDISGTPVICYYSDSTGEVRITRTNDAYPAIPARKSYEQYLTLIGYQGFDGNLGRCKFFSYLHATEILKEMEAPYAPDFSYQFMHYIWWVLLKDGTDPRVPDMYLHEHDTLEVFGQGLETDYRTDADRFGSDWSVGELENPPSDLAFANAANYRLADHSDAFPHATGETAERLIAVNGPLVCENYYWEHAITLIGYDHDRQELTFVDSATTIGVKTISYQEFDRKMVGRAWPSVTALKNQGTPLMHPYTARINVTHPEARSYLEVSIGAVGHAPLVVWNQNNRNTTGMFDWVRNLEIDVALPAYAADHWPPSAANPWYVKVVNHNPNAGGPVAIDEVTLVKRTRNPLGLYSIDTYRADHLPVSVPSGGTDTVFVPDTARVTAVPGGAGVPKDTNADGLWEDVNGNGRKDFADVVLYFNQMAWIAVNEPVSLFDYNGNGRIDFADVVWLFNHL